MPKRILLKTTIGALDNDWNVGGFSLLAEHLRSLKDSCGSPLYEVALLSRDHQDLGACVTRLGALGATQYFHTANPDPDESHRHTDDRETPSISWPKSIATWLSGRV